VAAAVLIHHPETTVFSHSEPSQHSVASWVEVAAVLASLSHTKDGAIGESWREEVHVLFENTPKAMV
jgi:hypothetical protein